MKPTIEEVYANELARRRHLGIPCDRLRIVRADMARIRADAQASYEKWRASVQDSLHSAPITEIAYRRDLEKTLREAAAAHAAGGPHYVLDYVYSGDLPVTWVGRYAS